MQALARVKRGGTPAGGTTGPAKRGHWVAEVSPLPPRWMDDRTRRTTTWISDIGRFTLATVTRLYRRDGMPQGEPSWKVDDRAGLYLSGTLRVPILVEVIAPPRLDPDFVQKYNDGGEPDAGERWPWVTEVRGRAPRVPLRASPDARRYRCRSREHEAAVTQAVDAYPAADARALVALRLIGRCAVGCRWCGRQRQPRADQQRRGGGRPWARMRTRRASLPAGYLL